MSEHPTAAFADQVRPGMRVCPVDTYGDRWVEPVLITQVRAVHHSVGLFGGRPDLRRTAARGSAVSADLLRRAAKAMRENAEATQISEHGPYWYGEEAEDLPVLADILKQHWITATHHEDAAYIASWHPAVALAAAGLLDAAADAFAIEEGEPPRNPRDRKLIYAALTLAQRYLGEVAP